MMADVSAIEAATAAPPQREAKVPYALLTLGGLLLAWELATRLFDLPAYVLPAPSAIFLQLSIDWKMLLPHTGITVLEVLIGFVLSVIIGVPIAICITYSRGFDEAIYPLIVGTQTIPKVALAPLLLAWFGYGMLPKVLIVFLVAFFPIVINSVVGLRGAPPQMIHLAQSMGATAAQIFWRFRLPQALPSIFAGMKLAIVLAVIGAIVAEFVGSDSGLGYIIMIAGSNFQIARQFGAIVALSLVGMVLFWIMSWIERRSLPWHISVRALQK
jgi:NitT/TauT family transport system permease protein